MVGHGVGLILSRHYFKDQDLLHALDKIFDNYQTYMDNAQKLAQLLPPAQGDRNAAQRIVELLDEFNINKK
jgi:hypothetical protein